MGWVIVALWLIGAVGALWQMLMIRDLVRAYAPHLKVKLHTHTLVMNALWWPLWTVAGIVVEAAQEWLAWRKVQREAQP